MLRFYIPQLNDRIRLTQDWSFKLHAEHRNRSLFELMKGSTKGIVKDYWGSRESWNSRVVTLRAGCLLQVDRIFIRKGSEGFDSITFALIEMPESMNEDVNEYKRTKKTIARFWVKIHDANNIYFEPATEPNDVEFNLT